ncbi:MAG: HdeD family acid-resistance protein [Rubrobacter sp.]|nr:HdeD family acid-resistance protein [Rubrobacter sp.]
MPAVTGHWWALALRGGVAILFGLAALLRPGIALETLILLFGAYALVDGVFSIVGVFGGARGGMPRWLLFLEGVVGVLVGLITFVFPILTVFLLYFLIIIWALVTGIAEIATAIRLRQEITGEWALILGGLISILFAVVLLFSGAIGVFTLVWVIGIYAIIFGVLLLITAFQVRGHQSGGGGGQSSRVN